MINFVYDLEFGNREGGHNYMQLTKTTAAALHQSASSQYHSSWKETLNGNTVQPTQCLRAIFITNVQLLLNTQRRLI